MKAKIALIAAEMFSRVWFAYAITIVAIVVAITMPRIVEKISPLVNTVQKGNNDGPEARSRGAVRFFGGGSTQHL